MHLALSRALFEKETEVLTTEFARRRRWIIHVVEYPLVDCSFTAPGRTPLGALDGKSGVENIVMAFLKEQLETAKQKALDPSAAVTTAIDMMAKANDRALDHCTRATGPEAGGESRSRPWGCPCRRSLS